MGRQEDETARLDQPELPGMEAIQREMSQRKSQGDRERSRKPAKKQRLVEHLKTMPYETTPAQKLMRIEMEAGGLSKLSEVLEGAFGRVQPGSEASQIAIEIIRQGESLTLSFDQWRIVQSLVETGFIAGYDRGSEDAAPDRG